MIIYSDGLIVLEYDTRTDILFVKWPNLIDVPLSVIENTFNKLSDTIKHYHISKLLLNSKGTLSNVPDEQYKPLATKLVVSLAQSNLKKIARVVSDDEAREKRAQEYNNDFQSTMIFNFISKEFEDEASAMAWLERDEK